MPPDTLSSFRLMIFDIIILLYCLSEIVFALFHAFFLHLMPMLTLSL